MTVDVAAWLEKHCGVGVGELQEEVQLEHVVTHLLTLSRPCYQQVLVAG